MSSNQSPSPVDSTALLSLEPSCPCFSTPNVLLKTYSSLQSDLPQVQIRSSFQSSGWRAKLITPIIAHKARHVWPMPTISILTDLYPPSGLENEMCRLRTRTSVPLHILPCPLHGLTFLLLLFPVLLLFIQPRPMFHTVCPQLKHHLPRDTHPDQCWLPCVIIAPYAYHLFYSLSHNTLTVNPARSSMGSEMYKEEAVYLFF